MYTITVIGLKPNRGLSKIKPTDGDETNQEVFTSTSTLFDKLLLVPRCKSYNYLTEVNICDLNYRERSTVEDEVPDVVQFNGSQYDTQNGLIAVSQSIYQSKNAFLLTKVISI